MDGWLCLETCPIPLAASAMAFGYAAWNVGILYGNVTVLAGALLHSGPVDRPGRGAAARAVVCRVLARRTDGMSRVDPVLARNACATEL